jgi:coenzyme PQQ precursor peptide PqqA
MKIMTADSCRARCEAVSDAARSAVAGNPPALLEMSMIWETPTAIDFRFGMEITMYVSSR